MFKSWRLGRVLGFPIEVNLSFLLLLGFVLIAYGGLAGVVVVGVAFGSVVLHELGHAVVARRLGVHVEGIELSCFGGAAKLAQLPRAARDEIAIAAAGPLVSVGLAATGFVLGAVLRSPWLATIGWINVVIAVFNLIPALPMDGGRILRAVLALRHDYVRATDLAVVVARVFTVAFAVFGLAFGWYQLALLAPFLWLMTSHERRLAHLLGDPYDARDGVEVLGRHAWERRHHARGVGRAFDPFAQPRGTMRRFEIRRGADGRMVIVAID